jgi:type VI secretion system secreted protein VgrG
VPGPSSLEIFEHPAGALRQQPDDVELVGRLDERVKLRMETEDARAESVAGESGCRQFIAGHRFELTAAASAGEPTQYLLTSVVHQAYQEGGQAGSSLETTYRNSFTCLPKAVPFRPPHETPWPRIQGPQTGFVVGDENQEISVDKLGRLRVQLHWSRKDDQHKQRGITCWARTAQTTAGNGWGTLFHPRVGQEVVVEFIDGDPDRPLVTGCVYNGTHKLPYTKPTQSGWRTRSTPQGGTANFNEIRFEDRKGEENLFVHAEGDLDLQVRRMRREWIGGDRHLVVKGKRVDQVDGDAHARIDGSRVATISGNRHEQVEGDEQRAVSGSLKLTVNGNLDESCNGSRAGSVGGALSLDAGTEIVIDAGASLTLKCGDSCVVIDPAGVTVHGSVLTLDGSIVNINSGAGSGPGSPTAAEAAQPDDPEDAEIASDITDVSDLPT